MVDLWEYVGRLVSDSAVSNAYLSAGFDAKYDTSISPQYHPSIPEADFDRMRELFIAAQGSKPHRPISLMALGEMLWAFSGSDYTPALLNLCNVIQSFATTKAISLSGRSVDFYVGLGAAIMDPNLRLPGYFDEAGFDNLQGQERNDVYTLVDPNAAGPAMDQFCNSSIWSKDCASRSISWPPHRHPVAYHD